MAKGISQVWTFIFICINEINVEEFQDNLHGLFIHSKKQFKVFYLFKNEYTWAITLFLNYGPSGILGCYIFADYVGF